MKHSEIIELLPWYATATLAEDERKVLEAHLADCRECAREVESLAMMQRTIVEIGNKVPAPFPMALNRALGEIEDYEQTKVRAASREPMRSSMRERITSFWSGWWRPTPLFARAIIAAQLVLVLGFGATIFYQQHESKIYATSSRPAGDRTSTRIAVSFSDSTSEQEIRQAILGVHGKIVDGPSALGLYTIQVPIPAERSTEIQNVLKTLRQNQRVIRFAEQKQ